jgi:hypothetical protein
MVRPTPNREAFLRLDPLIGEQAQIDWAHVGAIGDSKRYFERRRTLSDRSIPAPITSAQRA